MKTMWKKLLMTVLLAPMAAFASGNVHLDKAPVNLSDKTSLQRGAKIFVNYCLNCHSASYMRYNRLQDLGLTEQQIAENLMFTTDKVGNLMNVALTRDDGKRWFGSAPPDLTVISRSRGADWLYTYLRGFYRDPSTTTGWNNVVFDKVAMPHVLWSLQGQQVLEGGHEKGGEHKLVLAKPGSMKPAEYDAVVGDLVNYLVYMGEPVQNKRVTLGFAVIIFLAVFLVLAYRLKKEYWKDVH